MARRHPGTAGSACSAAKGSSARGHDDIPDEPASRGAVTKIGGLPLLPTPPQSPGIAKVWASSRLKARTTAALLPQQTQH